MIDNFHFVEILIKNKNASFIKIVIPVPENTLACIHGVIKDFPFEYRKYTQIHIYNILHDFEYIFYIQKENL